MTWKIYRQVFYMVFYETGRGAGSKFIPAYLDRTVWRGTSQAPNLLTQHALFPSLLREYSFALM